MPRLFYLTAALSLATAHTAYGFASPPMTPSLLTERVASLHSSTVNQEKNSMFSDFVNEDELLKDATFPIPPQELVERAKEVLSPAVAIGTKDGGECLADDFEFVAAVVGPIGKKEYLNALGTFDLTASFDINPNFYGMSVDPFQPNRVWFFNRAKATHTGTFLGAEPTGKTIEYPPQVQHLDFNADGKIKEYGFYTADRRIGNTGGLGGAFGFMYAVGKNPPIREFQPYKPSFRYKLFQKVGGVIQKFQRGDTP